MECLITAFEAKHDFVEVVERKGLGHPDSICDALAETLSRNLCREYRNRFGAILHHNVDKALLYGGRSAPAFGGGSVVEPITIYLAGRATTEVGGERLPIDEIAVEGSRAWMRANLHALDVEQQVRIHPLVRPGSQELQQLFRRGRKRDHPAWGEDVKVMGVRCGTTVRLTVACAMIGRYLAHIDDYLAEKAAIARLADELSVEHGFSAADVSVNAADCPSMNTVYLTVTGTSAEAGDDGQVGRGNRVNGLITPCRPMSLKAVAGKNPVTHVGKIYNVLAYDIAQTLVATVPEIAAAECLMVGQIGAALHEPAMFQVRLATRDGAPVDLLAPRAREIAADRLARIPELVDDFVAGRPEVF